MDTWATSSLTPQLAARWTLDGDLFARVYPMDLRPQAHEIIRTWLFVTLLRAQQDTGRLPWSHTAISGWVVDPAKKKLSKSAEGQKMVTPDDLLDTYGADAVRYWAASGRPGTDTAFDIGQMKIGRRLATKILNASRFVLGLPDPQPDAAVTELVDLGLLARLDETITEVSAALSDLDQGRAIEAAERFFWFFCDDYVELVKARAYGDEPGAASARAALRFALDTQLRLLAPMLPFVTEEVWSWWREGSVHLAAWPSPSRLGGDPAALDAAIAALTEVRRAKSAAKVSMKAEVARLTIAGSAGIGPLLAPALSDLRAAGRIQEIVFESSEGITRYIVMLT
jgi:valyl-tRNA synthetase